MLHCITSSRHTFATIVNAPFKADALMIEFTLSFYTKTLVILVFALEYKN